MLKRNSRNCFRITEDFSINFNRRYWFIEVENYFWTRFASVQFKNVTFRDWVNYIVEPTKPYVNTKLLKQTAPAESKIKSLIKLGGYYEIDKRKRKPLHVHIWYWKWPEYSEAGRKEWFMHEYIKTLVHELNHVKQHRSRNNLILHWDGGYYDDPSEVDCYALNAAQALVARFGIKQAKKKISQMKIKDSFCSEMRSYSKLDDLAVRHKFMKKTLKYIELYESYQQEWGDKYLFCYRIRKGQATSRQKIKAHAY